MHALTHCRMEDTDKNLLSTVHLFLEDGEARGLRPHTISFYRQRLGLFANRVNLNLHEIDAVTVRRYLLQRRQEVSAQTVHGDFRALRAFFSWCEREELIEANPMRKVQPPKADVVTKPPLSEEEIRRILKACDGKGWRTLRDKAIVLTLLDTGLRVSELVQMTVADGTSESFLIRGKNRRDRLVFLSGETRLAIGKYLKAFPERLDADSPLWQGERGALTAHGVQQAVESIGRRAGLPARLHTHSFRRTFAVYSLRSGISLEHLRELIGHRNFAMLKHYVQLVEQDLKQAHEKHSPLRLLRKR